MKKSKIMIVDDHQVNRLLLAKAFKDENYETISVESGEKTLEILETEIPDLIILDVMMPGLDGFEVCKRLKANPLTFEIPIIFLTALNDKKSRIEGLKLGAVDFISKPFDIFEIKLRVKQQLKMRELYMKIRKYNESVSKELNSARKLQMSILPDSNIQLNDELEFSFEYLPCDSLGGDFLDILKLDENKYCFYLADVSGHGVASSLVTIYLKLFFQKFKMLENFNKTSSEIIGLLNKDFRSISFGEKYLTIFVGILNLEDYSINWSFAGPNTIPLIIGSDKIEELKSSGIPVGWFNDSEWEDQYTKLEKNKTLLLYSDAAIEIKDSDDNMLQVEGLKSILNKINFYENPTYYSIVNELLEYSNKLNFDDDLTFLSLRRN